MKKKGLPDLKELTLSRPKQQRSRSTSAKWPPRGALIREYKPNEPPEDQETSVSVKVDELEKAGQERKGKSQKTRWKLCAQTKMVERSGSGVKQSKWKTNRTLNWWNRKVFLLSTVSLFFSTYLRFKHGNSLHYHEAQTQTPLKTKKVQKNMNIKRGFSMSILRFLQHLR